MQIHIDFGIDFCMYAFKTFNQQSQIYTRHNEIEDIMKL